MQSGAAEGALKQIAAKISHLVLVYLLCKRPLPLSKLSTSCNVQVAVENAEKVKVLQEKVKQQGEELATALENYNNERVSFIEACHVCSDLETEIWSQTWWAVLA